jgi:3-oxoacyl-[acyl-carrier-protein] synthase-1
MNPPGELFHDVYCDVNGERVRTDDWGFALLRTNALFRDGTDYTMSVSECGDIGAATAGLSCILAAQAWQRGYAHGPLALVSGASWGGLRGAAVLECERR